MIKVWLGNLGKYNEGMLVGEWIELGNGDENIYEAMVRIGVGVIDENGCFECGVEEDGIFYEETMIFDWECEIEGIKIGQYSNIFELEQLAYELNELAEYELEEIGALMRCFGYDFEEAKEKMENGDYTTIQLEDSFMSDESNLAYSFIDQVYGSVSELSKETLENYFDYESYGRDLMMEFSVDRETNLAISSY